MQEAAADTILSMDDDSFCDAAWSRQEGCREEQRQRMRKIGTDDTAKIFILKW